MEMDKALTISAFGMQAQTTRLRVIAENLANQDTTGTTQGKAPYRRKTITFADTMDRSVGTDLVRVKRSVRTKPRCRCATIPATRRRRAGLCANAERQ